jgi:putative spermidine/putrescine transport system substrate-binding protein
MHMNTLSSLRRVAALLLLAGVAGPALSADRSLVVSTYGLNGDLLKKHVYDPFKALCKCDLVIETGNVAERMAKLEARRANPTVDLIQMPDFTALEASNKGLLQPINLGQLKNINDVYDFGRDPLRNQQAVAYTVYSVGLVVRSDKPAAAAVNSWKDLWKPDLKGHLMLANITGNQGLATLYMADKAWGGVATDMSTGLGKIAEVKGNAVTFYTQTAQMTALFAQDEAWVAPVGRFAWLNLKKTGKPLKWVVPKEGQLGVMNVLAIPKGARNADLAQQLIDFWLSKDVQTALANDLVDSPINRTARPKAEALEGLTFGPEQINSLVFMKPEMVVRERAGWVTQWNRMISTK